MEQSNGRETRNRQQNRIATAALPQGRSSFLDVIAQDFLPLGRIAAGPFCSVAMNINLPGTAEYAAGVIR